MNVLSLTSFDISTIKKMNKIRIEKFVDDATSKTIDVELFVDKSNFDWNKFDFLSTKTKNKKICENELSCYNQHLTFFR